VNVRPLRVLYLLPAEGFGGAERQGAYHIAELPRHGVEVTAFAGPGEPIDAALREEHAKFVHFEHFPARREPATTIAARVRAGAAYLRAPFRAASEIERQVRGRRFDLIFANRTFAWLVAARLARRLGVPYVIRAGSRPAHPLLAVGLELLGRAAPPAAALYNCRAVERAIAPRLRVPSFLLRNAVDVRRFSPASAAEQAVARARLGLPRDALLVGLAARPAPEKGFDLFARMVATVCASDPRARFVVAGDFPWRAHYEAELRSAGLGGAVRFLGHVNGMVDFFRSVDVAVLTSREHSIEASPNALLEAMASGLPIVSTAVGGVPELVAHAREGYLTRDGDAEEFAARVLALLRVPALRREMGARGRLRAEEHRVPLVVGELAQRLRAIASSVLIQSSLGDDSCESITPFALPSTCSFEGPPSRPSSSSPGAAI
jgi:glycosyltransferase involved in cell wall biosynthesis